MTKKIDAQISTYFSEALEANHVTTNEYNIILADLLDMLFCEYYQGGYRVVAFPCGMPEVVLKVEYTPFGSQNVIEYET